MGEGALRKDFTIPPGEWSDDHAETIDQFFEEIVGRHVALKTGSYMGSGRVQTIAVKELPAPPKLLVIQPTIGGTAYVTLRPYPAGNITGWTNKGFTLSTLAAVNTQNVNYSYLILA